MLHKHPLLLKEVMLEGIFLMLDPELPTMTNPTYHQQENIVKE